jgi:hypothetical protein
MRVFAPGEVGHGAIEARPGRQRQPATDCRAKPFIALRLERRVATARRGCGNMPAGPTFAMVLIYLRCLCRVELAGEGADVLRESAE